MKVIDIIKDLADGKEIPHFIIDDQEYYVGSDGYLKEFFGDDVEWTLDYEWLNQEVKILEDKKIEKAKLLFFEETGEAIMHPRIEEYNENNFKELKRVTDELIEEIEKLKGKSE